MATDESAWWRTGVVYQVYPRSFADSDGDGIGDIPGLIAHLDHLGPDGLGIDAIWLSPIYPSPGLDLGYDVADHAAIDPIMGSDGDFDRLVREAHDRGIRVILDLVMNHTSDQHPWFAASRASRDGARADWYLWRDPASRDPGGRPRPPNNWLSFFGGSAWTWEPTRGQFYLHTFLPGQPDLNWRQPAVRAALYSIVRGWLARGVDGFRLDVFNAFLKDPDLASNPVVGAAARPWDRQIHVNDKDQPDLAYLLDQFRAIVDERKGRMSVGELFEGGPETAARYTSERHLVFDFSLIEQDWSAEAFGRAIDAREAAFGPDRWPTVVLSNHDRSRQATRLGTVRMRADPDAIAKAAAVVLMTLRGTPFLYYGEEIGLRDVMIPSSEAIDPPARTAGPRFPWWNRDQCRSPMPWAPGPGAGFTTGRPWIRLGVDHEVRNVACQAADPESVLETYRRLLRARRANPTLCSGRFARIDSGNADVLAWTRSHEDDQALVLVNFTGDPARVAPVGVRGPWRPLAGTHLSWPDLPAGGLPLTLRPYEAVVLGRVQTALAQSG